MNYPAGMPSIFTGQEAAIANYGDAIWIDLCDAMPIGKWFKPHDVVGLLPSISGLARVTQLGYVRAVLKAVHLDYLARPDDYDGRAPLETRGGCRVLAYRL
jgi:hypothetical protein